VLDYRSTKGEVVPNRGLPELVLIGLPFAVAYGAIARRQGRNTAGWTVLGFLFSLIPLVIIILLPKARQGQRPGVA
jgi:hypothetical protein